MSKYEIQFVNKIKNVKPELYLGIPGSGARGNLLLGVEWEGRKIVAPNFKNWLIIKIPQGIDIRECSLHVRSRVDLDTKCRIKEREWKIEFPYSTSTYAETPADVNITLAPDEPNDPDPAP